MANILNVISALTPYGGTITKLRALMKNSIHQHFLYHPVYDSEKNIVEKEIRFYETINVTAYYGIHNRNIFKHVQEINKIIKKHNIDIVHFYFNFENSFAPLIKLFNPKVILVRSIVGFDKKLPFARRFIINLGFKSVENYILISNYIKNVYEKDYPILKKKNSQIIYNGAVNVSKEKNTFEKRKILVSTSGICKRKNIIVLIETMNIIKNKFKRNDIVLYILGDGDMRPQVEKLIEKLELKENIILVGYTKEVSNYLDKCCIYVHPATTEGFGIAVTEAMQMHCPCIVSNKGALPELVVDGLNGFVVDAFNADEWAKKIILLFDDNELRSKQSIASYERAMNKFSLKSFIENHDLLYKKLTINNNYNIATNMQSMPKRLLIFHPTIAPYRIDFFNDLYGAFESRICLEYRNLKDQKFDYDKIEAQFAFKPIYLENTNGKSIWKQIDDFDPDIVMVSEYNKIALKTLLHKYIKCKKYKIVSICDDSYNMVAENNDFSKLHKIARRIMVPLIDDLILVDFRTTKWYKKHYDKGIYFPIIKPDERTRNEYKRILPQSLDTAKKHSLFGKRIFLFVGRLVNIKNIDSAIRAFAKLDQKENVFVIVGDGPEKDKLEKLSEELSTNTIFTGRLEGEKLNVWYNIAQIFILPSYQEPFGAVTNEALLAGCISLISEKAGSQCLIISHKNGDTFDPMNIDEMAKKMQDTLNKIRPLDKIILKDNLMLISYSEFMERLINSLKNIIKYTLHQ